MATENRATRRDFYGLGFCESDRTPENKTTKSSELDAAARGQGACTSTYARELLFRRSAEIVAGTRRNPEAAALARELSAIGNNLNQITRHMHTSGELDPFDDLRELLKTALSRVISA